jgi:hypothetical protein
MYVVYSCKTGLVCLLEDCGVEVECGTQKCVVILRYWKKCLCPEIGIDPEVRMLFIMF